MKKLANYKKKPVDAHIEEMLWESNAIEKEYSHKAMDNAIKAWTYVIKNNSNMTTKSILKIHQLLAKDIRDDIAGQVRHCDVWIGGHKKLYVSDALIKDQLKNYLTTDVTLIDEAKRVAKSGKESKAEASHLYFESIHPFEDFNGRVGRILWQVTRLRMGLPVEVIHEGYEQFEYYRIFDDSYKNPYMEGKGKEVAIRMKNAMALDGWRKK